MLPTRSLFQRLVMSAVFIAFVFGATGCGPDCEGLCNDFFDLCERSATCDEFSQEVKDGIAASCAEVPSLSQCVLGCDASDDEIGSELEDVLELTLELLDRVGC
jgi:hypothetical protein